MKLFSDTILMENYDIAFKVNSTLICTFYFFVKYDVSTSFHCLQLFKTSEIFGIDRHKQNCIVDNVNVSYWYNDLRHILSYR